MGLISVYALPAILIVFIGLGLIKGVKIFDSFLEGAFDGLKTLLKIAPSIIGLITAVEMFKASGALDLLTYALSPMARLVHMPPEVIPMALLRPISGGGSIALLDRMLATYGAESKIGLICSVMCGSTETTFYTITVYYGACGVVKTRHTVIAALMADAAAALFSTLIVNIFTSF
ncbi:MAG TPA: spore maturation protein [Clostridiales bacterium]|nr:spore maturation protein [Clostridiales bacterium]